MAYCVVFGCSTTDIATYEKDNSTFTSFGGKGANQAVALSRAGIKTIFLTKLSSLKEEKASTKAHLNNLKKNKVNTKYIAFDKYKNDFTKVYISKNGNNTLDEYLEISQFIDQNYISQNKKTIEKAKYVMIQLKVPIESTLEMISICKQANTKIVLTPCRTHKVKEHFKIIEDVDFITCNEKEAIDIFGNGETLSQKELHDTLKKYPNKLIVTLGNKGAKFFDGKKIISIKAINVKNAVDTTGAGDTFCANFVASLMEGSSICEAVQKGICASTIKIQSQGTQNGMPKKKERDNLYNKTYK